MGWVGGLHYHCKSDINLLILKTFAFMSQQYQKHLQEEIRRGEELRPEPAKEGRRL